MTLNLTRGEIVRWIGTEARPGVVARIDSLRRIVRGPRWCAGMVIVCFTRKGHGGYERYDKALLNEFLAQVDAPSIYESALWIMEAQRAGPGIPPTDND